jgi:hypothetical protein
MASRLGAAEVVASFHPRLEPIPHGVTRTVYLGVTKGADNDRAACVHHALVTHACPVSTPDDFSELECLLPSGCELLGASQDVASMSPTPLTFIVSPDGTLLQPPTAATRTGRLSVRPWPEGLTVAPVRVSWAHAPNDDRVRESLLAHGRARFVAVRPSGSGSPLLSPHRTVAVVNPPTVESLGHPLPYPLMTWVLVPLRAPTCPGGVSDKDWLAAVASAARSPGAWDTNHEADKQGSAWILVAEQPLRVPAAWSRNDAEEACRSYFGPVPPSRLGWALDSTTGHSAVTKSTTVMQTAETLSSRLEKAPAAARPSRVAAVGLIASVLLALGFTAVLTPGESPT